MSGPLGNARRQPSHRRLAALGVAVALPASLLAWLSSPTASAGTSTTFSDVADAYVTQASPTAAHGTGTVMRTQAGPTSQVALLRFLLSGMPSDTTAKATLEIYSDSTSASGVDISAVSGAWSDTSVTWDTRPDWGPSVVRSGPLTAHTWTSVDVSALVHGNGPLDLALTTSSSAAVTFSTRESTHAPRLVVTTSAPAPAPTSSPTPTPTPTASDPPAPSAHPRVFAYYYLWWSLDHWHKALGPSFPYAANPLPLPASLDASGCHPTRNFTGTTVTDVPARLYSQDDPGFIEADVRQAAAAGLTGFAVNWIGTGAASQTTTSNPYSRRLQLMVDAVHKVNAEGIPFKLWLSYKASASVLPLSYIENDLGYFTRTYGADPAFDRVQSPRVTVIWNGSRKYPVSDLKAVSALYGSQLRVIGDETKWSTDRAPYLEGDAYYWSSQDPYANPQSFQQLAALAQAVRTSGRNPDGSQKIWVAPVAPGYDKQLAGGSSCVPRKGGQTLRTLFTGNNATHPDDWALISWNEITEGTYVDPMTRYGSTDVDMMKNLIAQG